MIGTFWALVPAIVAIALALWTKEVYSSLFIGIVIGGLFYAIETAAGFPGFFNHIFSDGMIAQLSDSWNAGILVFLVVVSGHEIRARAVKRLREFVVSCHAEA